jgi:hypothetical protein
MAQETYETWLKQEFGGLIDALELGELQKRFLRSRWLDQVLWLSSKAKAAQRRYYGLRIVTIAGGVVVPALVSLSIQSNEVTSALAWITFSLSLAVALAAALEGFFRYGDRWRNYRSSAETLKSEGWRFFQLAGQYATHRRHATAFPAFAARVEELIQLEVEGYITRVVQEPAKKDGEGQADAAVVQP